VGYFGGCEDDVGVVSARTYSIIDLFVEDE